MGENKDINCDLIIKWLRILMYIAIDVFEKDDRIPHRKK